MDKEIMVQFKEEKLELDSMLLPSSEVYARSIKANEQLSEEEISSLYAIVQRKKLSYNKIDIEEMLDIVADIYVRFENKSQLMNSIKGKIKIVKHPRYIPFLIKQILFYIAVLCIEFEICNQDDILESIKKRGISISHNFFSRLEHTPDTYVSMRKYKQPNPVIYYMGQKNRELAVAINNLVYQAGKYDLYVDIFGGSGGATTAVPKRKRSNYVYNELNVLVYNLFEVIADKKKHKELIVELEHLKADLLGNIDWLVDVDFDKEIERFYYRSDKRDIKETTIVFDNMQDLYIDFYKPEVSEQLKIYMEFLREDMKKKKPNFSIAVDGQNYSIDELRNMIFSDGCGGYNHIMSFLLNYKYIEKYCDMTDCNIVFRAIGGTYYSEVNERFAYKSLYDMKNDAYQYRFYKYYAYFSNLRESEKIPKSMEVRYALAELFIKSLPTSGSAGISSVLRMNMESTGSQSRSYVPWKFLYNCSENNIEEMFMTINRVICENRSFEEIIDMYKSGGSVSNITHNKTLFYSDSPYLLTKDYDDKKHKVNKFTDESMKTLIERLVMSGDKFIFSCRAVKSSRDKENKMKQNKVINDVVFGNLQKYSNEVKQQLFVLAIENGERTLANQIENSEVAEIMITNYEIFSFFNDDTLFKVYSFEEFLELVKPV